MNCYETLYIVHPALEAGRLKDIIVEVEESLKKMGGDPLAVEFWGKRKLSYYIDKQKYGTYVLVQYNGEGRCTGDFAVELEHNPNILAYLTTSIDPNDVLEQEQDLDTQIAGKTRETARNEPARNEPAKKDEKKTTDLNNIDENLSGESGSGETIDVQNSSQSVEPEIDIDNGEDVSGENDKADLPSSEKENEQTEAALEIKEDNNHHNDADSNNKKSNQKEVDDITTTDIEE